MLPLHLPIYPVVNLFSALWNPYLQGDRVLQVLLQVHSEREGKHALPKLKLVDLPHANSTKFSACLVGQLGRETAAAILECSSHLFCGIRRPSPRGCCNPR